MTPAELHRLPSRDRADYYREQAARALQAAGMAKEPMARASLFRIAEAWRHLAAVTATSDESPSILSVLSMLDPDDERDLH